MPLIQNLGPILKENSIFITGGTGFFGRSFLDLLIDSDLQNVNLTILSLEADSFLNIWPKYKALNNLKLIKGDVQNFQFPEGEFDYLLHFATPASSTLNLENPILMSNIILNGMHHVLEFAKHAKVKKFLFASSGAVYGRQPPDLMQTLESYVGAPQTNKAGSAYGEAKRMAELLGCEYSRLYGFEFKIARCFAFSGPHLDTNGTFAIGNFLNDAINNRPINISGDGTSIRSYLYSGDLVVWLLKILIDGKNLEAYNVGSDKEISIHDLAIKIVELVNPNLKITVAKTADLKKPAERYVPSIEKAKVELGLDVWTDLNAAIMNSHAALLKNKMV